MFAWSDCRIVIRITLAVLIIKAYWSNACAPTTPASSPSVIGCTTCSIAQLTLTPASTITVPMQGPVILGAIGQNAAGCNVLPVACTGTIAALLVFNTTTLPADCVGPPLVTTCAEQLVCNSAGQWTFTQAGLTTTVNTITCQIF